MHTIKVLRAVLLLSMVVAFTFACVGCAGCVGPGGYLDADGTQQPQPEPGERHVDL